MECNEFEEITTVFASDPCESCDECCVCGTPTERGALTALREKGRKITQVCDGCRRDDPERVKAAILERADPDGIWATHLVGLVKNGISPSPRRPVGQ
jgi:hypothetical protein